MCISFAHYKYYVNWNFANRKKSVPLEAVKDDGILMYMVMIIKDISQPLKLSLINKKSAAKHLSHVLLLVRNAENLSLGWMRASFRQFWSIWLLNIVIIFYRDDRLHIYRYNPFTDDFLLPVDLSQNQSPTLQQLFPKNLPNMHRKPLRMCLYMDDVRAIYGRKGKLMGSDGLLASYIAKRLNATRIITRPLFYNQSTDLCSKEIANEFDDVAMNIRFLAPKTFKNRIEPTIAHNRDDLCVIVPKAKAELLFWNIFRSFGGWVWLAIGISVLLSYLFCQLLFFSTSSLPRHGRCEWNFFSFYRICFSLLFISEIRLSVILLSIIPNTFKTIPILFTYSLLRNSLLFFPYFLS